jgi:hypothetical protein
VQTGIEARSGSEAHRVTAASTGARLARWPAAVAAGCLMLLLPAGASAQSLAGVAVSVDRARTAQLRLLRVQREYLVSLRNSRRDPFRAVEQKGSKTLAEFVAITKALAKASRSGPGGS